MRHPDPEVLLRDIAASRGITGRSAYRTVTDLAGAGSVVRQKNRRRNRYQTRAHLPLPEPAAKSVSPATSWPFLPAPARGRNGALLGPVDDLGRFQQLRGGWP